MSYDIIPCSTFRPADEVNRHIVGLSLRLCVKLRYHRKIASSPDAQTLDPYKIELRKRFFWCAYCFDRFVHSLFKYFFCTLDGFNEHLFRSLSILTKLPFGISDSDIDAEVFYPNFETIQ